jgi:Tfp pilus assembly protein PilV
MGNIMTSALVRRTAIAAAVLAGGLAMTASPSKAQAPNAMVAQYGYQYCNVITQLGGDVHDCNYVTPAQCEASASGQGHCEENPAYIAARANAQYVPGPAPRRAHRRHHH